MSLFLVGFQRICVCPKHNILGSALLLFASLAPLTCVRDSSKNSIADTCHSARVDANNISQKGWVSDLIRVNQQVIQLERQI